MTISKDLFLAILALDAYNHGYDAGIEHGETVIGNATKNSLPSGFDDSDWQTEGFYGVAYTLNDTVGTGNDTLASGTTIISYRGTDNANPFSSGSDFWNGWVFGAGVTFDTQLSLARDFYEAVTGNNTHRMPQGQHRCGESAEEFEPWL